MEGLRKQLRVLSKRHSMEVLRSIIEGPKYISQISEEMGIPFATAQQRVMELERAGLVEVVDRVDEASKRAVRMVRLLNFRVELSPRIISQLMGGRTEGELRVS